MQISEKFSKYTEGIQVARKTGESTLKTVKKLSLKTFNKFTDSRSENMQTEVNIPIHETLKLPLRGNPTKAIGKSPTSLVQAIKGLAEVKIFSMFTLCLLLKF
jgi:hypothetical protein